MSTPSLTSLLARWEEAYLQGRDLSADDLCGGDPEVAVRLREGILWLRRMNGVIARANDGPQPPKGSQVTPPTIERSTDSWVCWPTSPPTPQELSAPSRSWP